MSPGAAFVAFPVAIGLLLGLLVDHLGGRIGSELRYVFAVHPGLRYLFLAIAAGILAYPLWRLYVSAAFQALRYLIALVFEVSAFAKALNMAPVLAQVLLWPLPRIQALIWIIGLVVLGLSLRNFYAYRYVAVPQPVTAQNARKTLTNIR